jgi:hypothetical protein
VAAVIEGPEQPQRLLDGQLVGQLRFLQLDPQALPEFPLVLVPGHPEYFDLAAVGREEAFENLDGGRLARAVGAKQAEALAAINGQREAVYRDDIAVTLAQVVAAHGVRGGHV